MEADMQRTSVNTGILSSVGYDSATQTLEIEFSGGDVYQYHSVPFAIYGGLMKATSHEDYFRVSIIDSYSSTKVGERSC
jgi:hypothetical protein